jgi:putative intracellular protease/amidase
VEAERAVHVVVFEGWADWEPSFALAEVRRSGQLPVRSVGFSPEPVRSMGGLKVIPDTVLDEVDPAAVRLLLLPGGDLWEAPDAYPRAALERLLADLVERAVPVAGICGATLALARAGLLNARVHTSNAPDFLAEHAKGYQGAARYVDALAVRDGAVITASGLGPIEFAREIFSVLEVFSAADRELWYQMFKQGRLPTSAN